MLMLLRRHGVAALIAGIALGVGARFVMRVIAWISGMPGAFSPGGSLEVIVFGALIGVPVALVFFGLRRRVPVAPPWPGPVTGAGLFAVLALMPPPAAQSALTGTPDPPVVTALLFLMLCVCFGAGLEWRWQRTRTVDG